MFVAISLCPQLLTRNKRQDVEVAIARRNWLNSHVVVCVPIVNGKNFDLILAVRSLKV